MELATLPLGTHKGPGKESRSSLTSPIVFDSSVFGGDVPFGSLRAPPSTTPVVNRISSGRDPQNCKAAVPEADEDPCWSGSRFAVMHDGLYVTLFRVLGILGLGLSAFLLGIAVQRIASDGISAMQLAALALACVALPFALAIWLRVRSPLALDLDCLGDLRAGGVWILSLRRRSCEAIRCPVQDLSTFLETFGWCGGLGATGGAERYGFATAKGGTVHLCFKRSGNQRDIVVSASLRDPHAFFAKLRDVMAATSHPLYSMTALYVAEWDNSPGQWSNDNNDSSEPGRSLYG